MKTESIPAANSDATEWLLAQLSAVLESSDDAITSQSLDGTISTWNPGAEKLFGYTAEEAIGSPISIIVPPGRAAEEPEILARLRAGGKIDHFETARMRKDGRRIEVSLTSSPMRDSKGEIVGACTIARDITERKAAAEQVQLGKEQLQAILTSIGDGVIVTDLRGYVLFLNPVAAALTRWKQEEAKGKPLETVFDIVNETSRQRLESPAAKAMREGVVVDLASHTILIARDRTEVFIDDSAAPIRSANGTTSGVVLVFRDVSAALAVDTVRARLSAIVEGSDDAVVGKDLEGRITSWNAGAERIFGYSQQEAIGRPITMLIPPDRLAEEADILERLRRGERVNHFETVRIAKDRRKFPVSLSISPIHDSDGHVIGASKIARDISDKKTAERELKEAHDQLMRYTDDLQREVAARTAQLKESLEELETFSSSMSHDLKTPLRAIKGHAENLQEDYGAQLPEEGREALRRISQAAARLSRFVDNVLSYARLRNEAIALEPIQLDLLVQRMLEDYPHARQADAEVQIEKPLHVVQGHESLLTQVMANLVSNGVKFVSPGTRPKVKIWSVQIDSKVRLYVEDNGIGIAKADHQKVFGLFTRLPGGERYAGSGVGLAVVQRAVRRMGGEVGLDSDKGKGSRFWFELNASNRAVEKGDGVLNSVSEIAPTSPRAPS